MTAHAPLRRHLRLVVPRVEARLLPAEDAPAALPEPLRRAAHGLRDQRDLLQAAVRVGGRPLGRRDAARVPLRLQGPPGPDPRAPAALAARRGGAARALPGEPGAARRAPRRGAGPACRRTACATTPRSRACCRACPACRSRSSSGTSPGTTRRSRRAWPRPAGRSVWPSGTARCPSACPTARWRTFGCARTSTRTRRARAGASCSTARPPTRPVFVFAKHEGVPAGNPHAGVGLAQWLVTAKSGRASRRPAAAAPAP